MSVPASLVKELREQTGAGMMECKRALEETGGDVDAARTLLREKGIAQAAKRSGRETSEGKVATRVSGDTATMVAVGSETEPVSNNDEFIVFVQKVLDAVERDGPDAVAELEDERTELVAKLGENIVVVGAVRFEGEEGDQFAEYVHPPARKIGVLVHARGDEDTNAARDLAMQIAFSAPVYLTRADVPEAEINAEREILSKQPDVVSKPEQVREKIVEGRIQKWLAGMVLLEQHWIHDTSKTVGQALQEAGLEVIDFRRFALSE